MEKYLFHSLMNSEYLGIVTVLDYEIRLTPYLSDMSFPSHEKKRKVIVDLALKAGVDQYRFVVFDIGVDGKIVLNSHRYIQVPEQIEKIANGFLQQNKEIVINSFLTNTQQQEILC